MPVPLVQVADGEQGFDALGVGLADADEDPGRERDAKGTGPSDRLEPPRRHLVRRAIVRRARRQQPRRGGFQHDPHADVDLAERGQVPLAHQPRVGVGQEPGGFQHLLADRAQVAERGAVAHTAQEGAVLREQRLRLVAQGEQRLLRAEAGARARQRQHLVRGHGEGARLAGILPERAVAAVVAAEGGQRDEHLGRERDAAAVAAVPQGRRRVEQRGQARLRRGEQGGGFRGGGHATLGRALERPVEQVQLEYCHAETRLGVTRIMRPRSRASASVRYWAYFAVSRSTPWENCGPSVSSSARPWMIT